MADKKRMRALGTDPAWIDDSSSSGGDDDDPPQKPVASPMGPLRPTTSLTVQAACMFDTGTFPFSSRVLPPPHYLADWAAMRVADGTTLLHKAVFSDNIKLVVRLLQDPLVSEGMESDERDRAMRLVSNETVQHTSNAKVKALASLLDCRASIDVFDDCVLNSDRDKRKNTCLLDLACTAGPKVVSSVVQAEVRRTLVPTMRLLMLCLMRTGLQFLVVRDVIASRVPAFLAEAEEPEDFFTLSSCGAYCSSPIVKLVQEPCVNDYGDYDLHDAVCVLLSTKASPHAPAFRYDFGGQGPGYKHVGNPYYLDAAKRFMRSQTTLREKSTLQYMLWLKQHHPSKRVNAVADIVLAKASCPTCPGIRSRCATLRQCYTRDDVTTHLSCARWLTLQEADIEGGACELVRRNDPALMDRLVSVGAATTTCESFFVAIHRRRTAVIGWVLDTTVCFSDGMMLDAFLTANEHVDWTADTLRLARKILQRTPPHISVLIDGYGAMQSAASVAFYNMFKLMVLVQWNHPVRNVSEAMFDEFKAFLDRPALQPPLLTCDWRCTSSANKPKPFMRTSPDCRTFQTTPSSPFQLMFWT